MIHLDASVLVEAFNGHTPAAVTLRHCLEQREPITASAVAYYEWLRGPRRPHEVEYQQRVIPEQAVIPFGPTEAAYAAELFRRLPHARARTADFAIAAVAIVHRAALWTLNPNDFGDIPDLTLFTPPRT